MSASNAVLQRLDCTVKPHSSPDETDLEDRDQRTVDPEVHHLTPQEVDDLGLDELDSNIMLLGAEADSEILDSFDRAMAADDEAAREAHRNLVAQELPTMGGEFEEAEVVAHLDFHGTTTLDLVQPADDSFGMAVNSYDGGRLDTDGFEVTEYAADSETDHEYRVVVIPRSPNVVEQEADEAVPADATDAATDDPPIHKACGGGSWQAFAAGFGVGYAAADGASLKRSRIDQLTPDTEREIEADDDVAHSVEDLISIRTQA